MTEKIIVWGFLLTIIGAAAETPQDGPSNSIQQVAGYVHQVGDLLLTESERTRENRNVATNNCYPEMCMGFQHKYFYEYTCSCEDCCYASDQIIRNNEIINECYIKNQDCDDNGYAIWAPCGLKGVANPPEGTPPNEYCPKNIPDPPEKPSTDGPTDGPSDGPSTLPTIESSTDKPTNKPPTDISTDIVVSSIPNSTDPRPPSDIVRKPWQIVGVTTGAICAGAIIILFVLILVYKKCLEKKNDDIQSAQDDPEASAGLIEPSSHTASATSTVPVLDFAPCTDTGGNEDGTDTTPIVQSASLAAHGDQIQFDPVSATADTTCIDVINDNIEASYERTMALQAERKTSMPSDNVSMETLDDSSIKAEESDDQRPNNPDSGFVTGGSMDQSLSSSKPESTECLSDGEGVSWLGQVLSLGGGAAAKSDNAINLDSLHQSVDLKPNADKVIDISPQGNVVEKAAEKLQHVADQRAFQEDQERPNEEQGAIKSDQEKWKSGQESKIAELMAFKENQEKQNIEQDVVKKEFSAFKDNQEKINAQQGAINAQQGATNRSIKNQITALQMKMSDKDFPEGVAHLAVGCLKNMAFTLINPIKYHWVKTCRFLLSCDHMGCNGSCFDAQGYLAEVNGIPRAHLLPKLKETHCYKLVIRFEGPERSDEKSIAFNTTGSTCKKTFGDLHSDMETADKITTYLDTKGKGKWVRQMLAQLMECVPKHENLVFRACGAEYFSVIQHLLEIKPEWPVAVLLICLRHFNMQDAIDELAKWHQDCPVCRDLYRGNQVGDRESYKVV